MNGHVRITDVSPRDGLQNEPGVVSTADKLRLVGLLAAAGVDEVEVTSFVSPKWVPALADATPLVTALAEMLGRSDEDPGGRPEPWRSYFDSPDAACKFSALVPNQRGMESLIACNVDPLDEDAVATPLSKIAVFTAASETFCQKNLACAIHESLTRFKPVIALAGERQLFTRGYISCAIACPFEGPIDPNAVADVAEQLAELGCAEIDLGDTIGAGTPETTRAMIEAVVARLGSKWLRDYRLTLHLHDTFGRAADCVKAALYLGIRSFDGSAAGLGGCPFAGTPEKPAPGNISTELLVQTIHDDGYETNVNTSALKHAATFARTIVTNARAHAAALRSAQAGENAEGSPS